MVYKVTGAHLTQCWQMVSHTVPATDWHRSQLLNPPTHTPADWLPQSTHIPLSHSPSACSTPSSPLPSGACGDADQRRHVWTSGCCVIHSSASKGKHRADCPLTSHRNLDLEALFQLRCIIQLQMIRWEKKNSEYLQTNVFYRAGPTVVDQPKRTREK